MPWSEGLRADIVSEFAIREGCMDYDANRRLTVVPQTHIGSPRQPAVGRNKAAKREYERKRLSAPAARAKEIRRKRVARMKNNIEMWKTDVAMILIGRMVSTDGWVDVLQHPKTESEELAQTDFIFFLKQCRNVAPARIASMLETSVEHVMAALARRGVT
jgi:hypothetical protein